MTRPTPVKIPAPRIVGVVASRADLVRAARMSVAPDLFELRLDALAGCADELGPWIARSPAPVILTARDPREGGANALSSRVRRALLERFWADAEYMDVELRSARACRDLLELTRKRGGGAILSYHNFTDTPAVSVLTRKAETAAGHGAQIFKVATQVDTRAALDRLLNFFDACSRRFPVAAMGMGKLGAESRRELALRGSCLNYAPLGKPQVAGQLTLRALRGLLRSARAE